MTTHEAQCTHPILAPSDAGPASECADCGAPAPAWQKREAGAQDRFFLAHHRAPTAEEITSGDVLRDFG